MCTLSTDLRRRIPYVFTSIPDGDVLRLPVVDLSDVAPAAGTLVEADLVRTRTVFLERQARVVRPDLDGLLDQRLHV